MKVLRIDNSQTFGGKLVLSNTANEILEKKINKLPAKSKSEASIAYNKLIRNIVNSDYDAYVTSSQDNKLVAKVTKRDKNEILSSDVEQKIHKSPIDFLKNAFYTAKNSSLS